MSSFKISYFQLLSIQFLLLLNSLPASSAQPLRDSVTTQATLYAYEALPQIQDPPNADEPILQELDASLTKLANVYMQALFSGTHNSQLEAELDVLELRLFDLLDALYKEQRMAEYMKYEAEVTHQMIIYNLLKKLFGYVKEDQHS
ncbi:uncharacterized protein LOC101461766 [Ceratitis capitata]|uniref:(Mediterranean fruit fly) hypothetical protein n=1 Tax=Ceratitis capitata TaxID=7213 RepID=A0A811VFA9_CERCA|nr:uncharacterized protein LOC101461766 [Ceratitis capitata]CAD7012909.1 unnamed protein product [Ceratitis capitata]